MKMGILPDEKCDQGVINTLFSLAVELLQQEKDVLWVRDQEFCALPSELLQDSVGPQELEHLHMYYANGKMRKTIVQISSELTFHFNEAAENEVGLILVELGKVRLKMFKELMSQLELCENILKEKWPTCQIHVVVDIQAMDQSKLESWMKPTRFEWYHF